MLRPWEFGVCNKRKSDENITPHLGKQILDLATPLPIGVYHLRTEYEMYCTVYSVHYNSSYCNKLSTASAFLWCPDKMFPDRMYRVNNNYGQGLGVKSGLVLKSRFRVKCEVIVVVFQPGHSDRGHFDLVPNSLSTDRYYYNIIISQTSRGTSRVFALSRVLVTITVEAKLSAQT